MAATGNGETDATRRAGLIRALQAAAAAVAPLCGGRARVWVRLGARSSCRTRRLPSGRACYVFTIREGLLAPEAKTRMRAALGRALARAEHGRALPALGARAPVKCILFRSPLSATGKEGAARLNQGTFYLASALRAQGGKVVLCETRVSEFDSDLSQRKELERCLAENPDAGLVVLSLYDAYFEQAERLCRFVRERSRARVAIGSLMPTRDPLASLVHLSGADMLGRGAGEVSLPRLARAAIKGSPMDEASAAEILDSDGVIAMDGAGGALWGAAESVQRVANLDEASLDFSLIEKRDAESGPAFCFSRGCLSACHFCTSPDRARFRGKSPSEAGRALAAYGRRLRELYGSWSAAPAAAFGVGFYDDDFLADSARARELLEVLRRSPFHLRFVQTSVRAFLRVGADRAPGGVDPQVVDLLAPELFVPKRGRDETPTSPQVYLGTESFCDVELRRLGKGYSAAQAEAVARALSARGLRQAHHFIASNARTRPQDVLESLSVISRLVEECAPAFALLQPVIPRLLSLPGTASLRALERAGLEAQVRKRATLRVAGFPEFDYPLVEHDEPLDQDVAAWVRSLEARGGAVDWRCERDRLLREWRALSESLAACGEQMVRARRLAQAVESTASRLGVRA